MFFRSQQYYKINRHLRKAYHRKECLGDTRALATLREVNQHIVAVFSKASLITAEWAAILEDRENLHSDSV